MPAYRGKNVVVTFGGDDISGDGRSTSFEQNADSLDDTTYGADERTKQGGLLDGSGTFEALDTTGAWSDAWEAVEPGTAATMIIQPEGAGSGKRQLSFTALITSRSIQMPYDDLTTVSIGFDISGAVTEGVQGA